MDTILTSRKFWASILMLVVVILQQFIPGFKLDVEHSAGLLMIVLPYIIGVAADPGIGWRGMLSSRKFWAAMVGLIIVGLDAFGLGLPKGLPPEALYTICATLGAYIGGVAIGKYVDPAGPAG